jgi:hypothetical protein
VERLTASLQNQFGLPATINHGRILVLASKWSSLLNNTDTIGKFLVALWSFAKLERVGACAQ